VTFDADAGRFEAKVVPGETVSKEHVVELIMGHGQSRGMAYEIRWGEPPKQAATKVATRAEPFELPTLGGGRYDLGAVLGRRPIVLVFWASWCEPCIDEAPHLVRLHDEHGERIELVSVSVDAMQDHDELGRVVTDLAINYPVALDPDGDVLAKYARGATIPLTFVIDRNGDIVYQHGNFRPGDEDGLAAAIAGLTSDSGVDR
jgi:thiol-disulfide isomerase/thioredoxin